MVPICDLYCLPMSFLYGTVLQSPSQSHMGCPYWTHIKSHMGPLLVLYYLLAGTRENNFGIFLFATLDQETQPKMGQFVTEKIDPEERTFFSMS